MGPLAGLRLGLVKLQPLVVVRHVLLRLLVDGGEAEAEGDLEVEQQEEDVLDAVSSGQTERRKEKRYLSQVI